MKMETRGLLICFTLLLALVNVYSIRTLNNTDDLKETEFGQHFPRHGLKLLLWLICQGKLDQNGILQLNFNPAQDVFGSHQFKNQEGIFPDLSNLNKIYYTIGNIGNHLVRDQFPKYVSEDFCRSQKNKARNQDRVVIRVDRNNPRRVDEVYITQHYDSESTYKISEELLREIEKFCYDLKKQNILKFLSQAGYVTDKDINQHSKSSNVQNNKGSGSTDPECDTANIQGYQANLQLSAQNDHVFVQLYVSKSFTDWRNIFYYAWVGLYTSADIQNSEYEKYAWITDFKKSELDSEDFDVYEYESDLTVAPGVQARFMVDKSYTSERARTEPWVVEEPPQSWFAWGFWFKVLCGLVVVYVITNLYNDSNRPTQAPPFVAVSEGHPGF